MRIIVEALENRRLLSATLQLNGTQSLEPSTPMPTTLLPNPPHLDHEAEMEESVDPTNPLDVAVAETTGGLFLSVDGGKTFAPADNPDQIPDSLDDPQVAYDSAGNLFVSSLTFPEFPVHAYGTITVWESTDHGVSFTPTNLQHYTDNTPFTVSG